MLAGAHQTFQFNPTGNHTRHRGLALVIFNDKEKIMKHLFVMLTVVLSAAAANAQDVLAKVTGSQPIIQQVGTTQRQCDAYQSQQVMQPARTSGLGSVLGAIAGAAMGNQVGGGNGRTVATVVGGIAGATVGDHLEAPDSFNRNNMPVCQNVTSYETRTTGYRVTYEYAGVSYTGITRSQPGEYLPVRVNVTPSN